MLPGRKRVSWLHVVTHIPKVEQNIPLIELTIHTSLLMFPVRLKITFTQKSLYFPNEVNEEGFAE